MEFPLELPFEFTARVLVVYIVQQVPYVLLVEQEAQGEKEGGYDPPGGTGFNTL